MSMTWLSAVDTIRSARNKAAGKPIQNNTRLYQRGEGDEREFGIVLHATEVVTIHADDTYTLRSGGYHTPTTMDRIRRYSPAKLFSVSGDFYLWMQPNPKDPRPDRLERAIPRPFEATDPGPEPVRTTEDCVAGQMVTTNHVNELVETYRRDMLEGDEFVEVIREGGSDDKWDRVSVRRTWNSHVYIAQGQHWDEGWAKLPDNHGGHGSSFVNDDGEIVKRVQCAHCAEFDAAHSRWYYAYHGGQRYGSSSIDQRKGYALYAAMMERFGGDVDAWQEAYIEDFRARRDYLAADREWEERNRVPFFEGIKVDSEGYAERLRAEGPSPAKLRRHEANVERMKKRIDKYIRGYIAALSKGMNMPSRSDCWYCSMVTEDGKPLGDAAPTLYPDGHVEPQVNTSHLLSHMEESYYVPTLAVNALRDTSKLTDTGIYLWLDMNQDTGRMGGGDKKRYDSIARAIRKYMRKRLVPAAPTS